MIVLGVSVVVAAVSALMSKTQHPTLLLALPALTRSALVSNTWFSLMRLRSLVSRVSFFELLSGVLGTVVVVALLPDDGGSCIGGTGAGCRACSSSRDTARLRAYIVLHRRRSRPGYRYRCWWPAPPSLCAPRELCELVHVALHVDDRRAALLVLVHGQFALDCLVDLDCFKNNWGL